jgi:hypothetical protein
MTPKAVWPPEQRVLGDSGGCFPAGGRNWTGGQKLGGGRLQVVSAGGVFGSSISLLVTEAGRDE